MSKTTFIIFSLLPVSQALTMVAVNALWYSRHGVDIQLGVLLYDRSG